MKKVLVPLHLHIPGPETFSPLHGVRATYLSKLVRYNLCPVLMSVEMSREMVDALYEEADGVMFTGGHDFDARLYNEANHIENENTDPKVDQLELYLLKRMLKDRKPFLGICRGCQGLAIASGGSLHQHLPELDLGEEHGDSEDKGYSAILKSPEHEIYIQRDSRAFNLLGKSVISATTGHHQGIKEVGDDISVVGRSPAGVPEILEHKDADYFCFGVQGHPEIVASGDLEVFFVEFARVLQC